MTRILGIDPGLAATGWGIIEGDGIRFRHLAHGTFKTKAGLDDGSRLLTLYKALIELIDQYKPSRGGIETLYFSKNTSSALPVSQARGVLLLGMTEKALTVAEFTPKQIKQAVVGTGSADKNQVQQMVRLILKMETIPKPDHAADALAAALCCAQYHPSSLSAIL